MKERRKGRMEERNVERKKGEKKEIKTGGNNDLTLVLGGLYLYNVTKDRKSQKIKVRKVNLSAA